MTKQEIQNKIEQAELDKKGIEKNIEGLKEKLNSSKVFWLRKLALRKARASRFWLLRAISSCTMRPRKSV